MHFFEDKDKKQPHKSKNRGRYCKVNLAIIPIAGDKLQNGISRFWTTFLDHLSGPPLFSFLSSSSFCKYTMNIQISQEKMGDNLKKVANLFVISDFCSIFAEAKLHSVILKQVFIALVCIYFAIGLIRLRAMTSVFVG